MIDVLGNLIKTCEKLSEYLLSHPAKDFDIPDCIYSPWMSALTDAEFAHKRASETADTPPRGGVDAVCSPTIAAAAPCPYNHRQMAIDMPNARECHECGAPLR